MPKLRVKCSRCNGLGSVAMTKALTLTYRLLCQQRKPISGAELARKDGSITGVAMANRLLRLEALGLAEGERDGKERLWVAVRS